MSAGAKNVAVVAGTATPFIKQFEFLNHEGKPLAGEIVFSKKNDGSITIFPDLGETGDILLVVSPQEKVSTL